MLVWLVILGRGGEDERVGIRGYAGDIQDSSCAFVGFFEG